MKNETSLPTLTADCLTITFRIHPDPLHSRRCIRCEGTNFRALVTSPIKSRAVCDRSMEEEHSTYCGAEIKDGVKCGDEISISSSCDEQSPASLPMSVCLDCGRLTLLV